MDVDVIGKIVEKILENGNFGYGFMTGAVLMLIFRKVVIKFLIEKVFKLCNGKKDKTADN